MEQEGKRKLNRLNKGRRGGLGRRSRGTKVKKYCEKERGHGGKRRLENLRGGRTKEQRT